MNLQLTSNSPRRRLARAAVSVATAAVLAVSVVTPSVVGAPVTAPSASVTAGQNVDWMSSETAAYLGSIGMDVMVPSWIPAPFAGFAPDVYAGDGSYSLYWMIASDSPTFLHITGVVGAAFPDGSKADLNIPLSVNASVQGWPAIHDLGIPAGSDTPIYDQVWWIAGGVRYSVESNNMSVDSLTLAESMIYLEAPAPVETEEPYVPPTEEPAAPTAEVPAPVSEEPVDSGAVTEPVTASSTGVPTSATEAPANGTTSTGQTPASRPASGQPNTGGTTTTRTPAANEGGIPSDGTAGPRPPVIGGDGTGGWFDTSLPRIFFPR